MCDKIKNIKVKQTTLIPELVQVTSSVLVRNIEDCDIELIEFYFNNEKKSGGRNVKDVHFIDDESIVVIFADPKGMYISYTYLRNIHKAMDISTFELRTPTNLQYHCMYYPGFHYRGGEKLGPPPKNLQVFKFSWPPGRRDAPNPSAL